MSSCKHTSGEDEQAKETVAQLIDEISFGPIDAGTLAEGGRKHQTGTPAYTNGVPTRELRALRVSPPIDYFVSPA